MRVRLGLGLQLANLADPNPNSNPDPSASPDPTVTLTLTTELSGHSRGKDRPASGARETAHEQDARTVAAWNQLLRSMLAARPGVHVVIVAGQHDAYHGSSTMAPRTMAPALTYLGQAYYCHAYYCHAYYCQGFLYTALYSQYLTVAMLTRAILATT